jgi:Transglycosylase SLT domain
VVGSFQTITAQAAFAPHQNPRFTMQPKTYARLKVHDSVQFACLDNLYTQESHWNPKAFNKQSGAFGIAQFLPTTWGNYKFEYKPTSAIKQIQYGLHYISVRYGSPCAAWRHEQRYGWY